MEAAGGANHGDCPEQNLTIETKPTHIQTKQGTAGRGFIVKANYFALNSKIKWQIFHYHVEFVPEIVNSKFRYRLLEQQQPRIGSFLYDRGSSIFTVRQLESEIIEIITRDQAENEILIKITRVGLISPYEIRFLQLLNIIMKKAFGKLNLQRVGRDYFDANAKVFKRTYSFVQRFHYKNHFVY